MPDANEARAIFDARRIIEAGITRAVAEHAPRAKSSHRCAATSRPRRLAAGLASCAKQSGCQASFTFCWAPAPEIRFSIRWCGRLVARIFLVVALYENQSTMICWHDDHAVFLKLLESNKAAQAVALMRKHLSDVQQSLDLQQRPKKRFDLRAIYAPGFLR